MKLKQKLALRYIRARLNILSLVSPKAAAQKAFQLFCTPMQRVRKRGGPLFAKGEKLSFRLEGHTVRGHRWVPRGGAGPASAGGKQVLIVHGFESSARNYEQYVSALLKKGYTVVAFDAPGHGASGGRRITLPLYVEALQVIQEQYGPFSSYMAHSFGGLALALCLEEAAEDGPDAKTKLVLIAPVAEMTTAVNNFFQLLRLSDAIRAEFDELGREVGGHPWAWYSLRRSVRHIPADILWVQDEDDLVTPLSDAELVKAEQHRHLQFLLTSGLGHRKIYRDPEVLRQIVDFL